MTVQLQSLTNQAKKLSDSEQMELISAISDFLQRKYNRGSDFWNAKTISELADEQQVNVPNNIADLAVDF